MIQWKFEQNQAKDYLLSYSCLKSSHTRGLLHKTFTRENSCGKVNDKIMLTGVFRFYQSFFLWWNFLCNRPYALTSHLHNNDARPVLRSAHWHSALSVRGPGRASPAVWHAGVAPLAACLAMSHVAVPRLTPNTGGRPSVTSYCIWSIGPRGAIVRTVKVVNNSLHFLCIQFLVFPLFLWPRYRMQGNTLYITYYAVGPGKQMTQKKITKWWNLNGELSATFPHVDCRPLVLARF